MLENWRSLGGEFDAIGLVVELVGDLWVLGL
jgi:hypothetical protein